VFRKLNALTPFSVPLLPRPHFHLVAYVYEFARKSRSDAPVLMVSSDLTAKQHLQSTGLYEDLTRGFPK
jgi:hypothetical protein